MKRLCAFLGLAVAAPLALSACTPVTTGGSAQSASQIVSGPFIGRCHMGGCGWYDIQSFEMVRETPEAALLRLTMRNGGSQHPGDYPESSRGVAIDWGPVDSDTHVFCSTKMPAIISRGENGGWEGYRIDPTMSMGATESINRLYAHVCHNGQDIDAEGAAERLGYTRAPEDAPEIQVTSPEQLFDLIR